METRFSKVYASLYNGSVYSIDDLWHHVCIHYIHHYYKMKEMMLKLKGVTDEYYN